MAVEEIIEEKKIIITHNNAWRPHSKSYQNTWITIRKEIYIYKVWRVCIMKIMCVYDYIYFQFMSTNVNTRTHTHTYINIYIYIVS